MGLPVVRKTFESADDSFFVVGVDAGGGLGVGEGELAVEDGEALVACPGEESPAKVGVWGGGFKEAFGKGLDVEAGASDGEGDGVGLADGGDGGIGVLDVLGDGEFVPGLGDIDAPVGNLGADMGGRLGGSDIHAAVDFHGIDADDLAGEACGELAAQRALAACGATHDEIEGIHRGYSNGD